MLVRLAGTRTGELLEAVAARCERMVSASVREPGERLRQRRLIGVALVAPFLGAAAAAVLLPPQFGIAATLAAMGAIFLVPALAVGAVIVTGRAVLAEGALLAFGVCVLAMVVAAAGGASSPAALVLAALAFEAWWVRRTGRAALIGTVAALAALAMQAILGAEFMPGDMAISPAHWILPIAYLGLVVPRLAVWMEERGEVEAVRPLEDIIEAVVMRMDLSGEVTDASEQARRIIGLAPELLLSSGVFDRMHVADRVGYLCALSDLREGAGFRRVEARMRVPGSQGQAASDFRSFVLEMMRPSPDERSITLLLRADTPNRSQAEAGRGDGAGELANVRMLAAVSHELRTPLNCIIGFSDMLLHEMLGSFSDPRQKEYVGLVKESGNHLLSVVNAILDVSRIESGAFSINPEAFRFADTVETCRQMLAQKAAEKGVGLVTDIPVETGELHADKRALRQILINLVSNAVKFTPAGGTVAVGAKRNGTRLQFWVSDTGVGIHEHDLGRIGQPFVQAPCDHARELEGTGLGLSVVKGLVALHKGALSIESEPGHGTTVTVSLPVEQHVRGAIDLAEIRAKPADRSKETDNGTYRKTA